MTDKEVVVFDFDGPPPEDEKVREAVAEIKALYKEADFLVWSDASAIYADGVGTWASVVFSRTMGKSHTDFGVSTATNTNRAEFMGTLSGLARVSAIAETMRTAYPGWSPAVLILGDRENIIEAVENKDSRKTDVDLWAAFKSYEDRGWRIRAKHIPRDCKLLAHEWLDKTASEMRVVLMSYLEHSCPAFPIGLTALKAGKY